MAAVITAGIYSPFLAREPADRARSAPLLSPITERRLRNFRANRRGLWALRLFICLFLVTLFAEFIANDRPLVLFAEGTRIPHGFAPPLRSGFAGIYRLLGVPVIPVAVNSGLVYPPRRWVKWSGTITYRVGETIPAGLPREEAEERVWRAINALNPPEALLASKASA